MTDAARRRLEEISAEVCTRREEEGEWLGVKSLWEQTRSQIVAAVDAYVTWELEHMAKKGEYPVENEASYGFDDDVAILAGHDAHGRPARLRIRGRIDRLDRIGSAEAGTYHVLDYKSSSTPSNTWFDDGTALQGVLYAQVMADRGCRMGSSRYRAIKNPGKPQNGGLVEFGAARHEQALSMALTIPSRAASGLFEAVASWKGGWKSWDPGREIRRTEARHNKTNRFEAFPNV